MMVIGFFSCQWKRRGDAISFLWTTATMTMPLETPVASIVV
jgi:hypothetical protein